VEKEFEFLSKNKGPILVTGHTGFKGTWMTLLLEAAGIEVAGLSLPPDVTSLYSRIDRKTKIREEFVDIRSAELTNAAINRIKPSAVIHMAADPLVLESYREPRRTFETNVMGTVNILDASRRNDVEIVQVITTDKVYENLNHGNRFVESDPLKGKDPYSASKVGAESAVSAWRQITSISNGTLVHSVRAGNVIGGGDLAANRLLPDVIRSFWNGGDLIVRSPESTRPWQHVLDPLLGYLKALAFNWANNQQEDFNFGPSEPSLSVREVLNIVKSHKQDFSWVEQEQTERVMESVLLDLNSGKSTGLLGWTPCLTQRESVIETLTWWQGVDERRLTPYEACFSDIMSIAFRKA